jgi:putative intracellular protease/amidase
MREVLKRTTDETRRNFLKSGAGAVLAASCLTAFGPVATSLESRAAEGAKAYICPPCGKACDKLSFDKPGACPECGMNLVEKTEANSKPVTVSILLFDGVEIIDYSGPWEVFGQAGFEVHTVAEKSEAITTSFGQKVTPEFTLENSPKSDILLVPGGDTRASVNNPRLIKWVQSSAKDASHVMSVCTGAFILAKAGLLDGLTATTFHNAIEGLAKFAPKTKVVYDQRYVDNGKVITTAGLSSGIDGALYLVSKILGKGEAQSTALGLEYRWDDDANYARAAFADRYLPDFKGFDAKTLAVGGDTNRWELKALVSSPASASEIMALASKQLVSDTPHTRGAVTLMPRGAGDSEVRWKFTDERGRGWSGVGVAEPSAEDKGKFVVTLKLARDNSR